MFSLPCTYSDDNLLFSVALVENLTAKVKAWEEEKGIQFMYDKVGAELVFDVLYHLKSAILIEQLSYFRFPYWRH